MMSGTAGQVKAALKVPIENVTWDYLATVVRAGLVE